MTWRAGTLFYIAVACLPAGSSARAQTLLADVHAQLETALTRFEQAQELHGTQRDRAREMFLSAAQQLEAIVATGIANGKLEYNIGNCYLQAGDIGQAILHYRRAERLMPRDPYLADNLQQARSRRLTTIEPQRRNRLLRGLLFLHHDLSTVERARLAVAAYVGFWVLLVANTFLLNRTMRWCTAFLALMAVTLGGSVAYSDWADRNVPPGVVTEIDVVAYKGPGTSYQRRFEQPLQPGVEFTRIGARGEWWQIALADGNTGWVESNRAELIPPS